MVNKHGRLTAATIAKWLLTLAALALPVWAGAEPGIPAFSATPAVGGGTNYALPLQTMLLMTAIGFIPAALLMMTSFTRIIIVLSLLLTLFVMGPVFDKIYTDAYQPLQDNKITMGEAMDRGAAPLRAFMMKQTRQPDLALFIKLSRATAPQGPDDVPMRVLIPSFITSELKTAFQIGFAIFIPFLIIDMVVASVLMSMGMMMMSPATISLPFKLMLFVLVDGWQLLLGSLAQSFY